MTNDDAANTPAPSERREAVREKAQQVSAQHARARKIRVAGLWTLGAVVIAAIVGGVVFAASTSQSTPLTTPLNTTSEGGIPIIAMQGMPMVTATPESTTEETEAPAVEIQIFVDYLAPGAKEFERANSSQLANWFSVGSANLTYYPVSMLTAKSNGTKYSLRAASAIGCVASYSPDYVFAYSHELLLNQPAVDSAGMSDADLAALAIAVGASSPKEVRACIESEKYVPWAKSVTEGALAGIDGTDGLKLSSTPLVLVNGEPYLGSLDDPKEFAQFVLTTASEQYYQSTPTPVPSASE